MISTLDPEADLLLDVFRGAFRGVPDQAVWEWADEHVYFSEKMAAEHARYISAETPWAREWQDLPRQKGVHECSVMKSSQSSATESVLNVIRWRSWPGCKGISQSPATRCPTGASARPTERP
jgi:hypothetical protein